MAPDVAERYGAETAKGLMNVGSGRQHQFKSLESPAPHLSLTMEMSSLLTLRLLPSLYFLTSHALHVPVSDED